MTTIQKYYEKIKTYENNIALYHKNKSYTYLELSTEINTKYNNLKSKGILSGQIVFIIGDYCFDSISLFFALALNNNIIVPVTSSVKDEIEQRILVANPDWIINVDEETEKNIKVNIDYIHHDLILKIQNDNVPGLLLFSSGSTGKPKAMIHNLSNLISLYLIKKQKNINFLVFLMFDHIGGLNTLLNSLSMGAKITIPENRKPDHICELIEKYKVNILPASPTFLNLLFIGKSIERYNLKSLLMITYGTEPMPESLLIKLKEILPSIKFLQTFGTSETGIAKTTSQSSKSTFVKIDDPDQEYKIVDGELWLRSKSQILGYINHNNDSFTEDGWFKTGDLVENGTDGYIKIIGRSKEVINIGGEKVLPAEIESIILQLDWVKDCTVSGKFNAITGQMIHAEVCLSEIHDNQNAKIEIKKHCQKYLDSYKVPSKINIVDNIKFSERFKKIRINP